MNDLISRQAAIDAIDRLDIPEDMCVFEILSHIELEIGNLPPAQPSVSKTETVGDVISRQAAIDAVAEGLKRTFVEYRDVAEKMLNKVPSAQPEQMQKVRDKK